MNFLRNLAEVTKPIRDLLKIDAEWIWDSPQKEAFDQLKHELASDEPLALFDSEKETSVSAMRVAMGFSDSGPQFSSCECKQFKKLWI